MQHSSGAGLDRETIFDIYGATIRVDKRSCHAIPRLLKIFAPLEPSPIGYFCRNPILLKVFARKMVTLCKSAMFLSSQANGDTAAQQFFEAGREASRYACVVYQCMCICICVRIHVYIYIYTYIYKYIHIHQYTALQQFEGSGSRRFEVCIYSYIYAYFTYVYLYIYISISSIYIYIYIHT